MSLSVAVAGASGYAGGELLRLLAHHPELEVRTVTAHANAGQPLVSVHPNLRSFASLTFQETTAEVLAGHDVVFLALPHGHSGGIAAQLPESTLVVDAGADHRLERADDWQAFYGTEHAGTWPYGMPELILADGGRQRRELRAARRIAAPGCNATAVTLAAAPGIAAGLIDATALTSVLAVGSSGAGRAAKTQLLAAELTGSAAPYGVGGSHRHLPEIAQNLRAVGAAEVRHSFTPVLVPMTRGILATVTAPLIGEATPEQVRSAWLTAYGDERFIHVLPTGEYPRTADVLGSNSVHIGVGLDEAAGRVVMIAAIDNLGKGTAGAAVQSANIALGFDEQLGLPVDGVAP
ncbi:N-acetyl-gamma-glutamyl-phosphate reductase [Agrococcus sediminis]|uniref:N-acetyl-gamma-glutamyl-phosphate reductase n=1 Tax=Agrococcus sediminis TaxID=2599924 RepID=A0A5M8QTS9_9MICO|nr:N-acetyl-gamma-glutamyl-phosphate reductase [Agrococcus sediminis]KAA6437873.1 N-acetyl-gamma-glutamyl-phosphate reductase [Agrococcus sediminis]